MRRFLLILVAFAAFSCQPAAATMLDVQGAEQACRESKYVESARKDLCLSMFAAANRSWTNSTKGVELTNYDRIPVLNLDEHMYWLRQIVREFPRLEIFIPVNSKGY